MSDSPDFQARLLARTAGIPITRLLITANALIFIAMLGAGGSLGHAHNGIQLAWGANFGPATQDGQWWRLGSAMFLHFGLIHLLMNLWALWDGGQLVERIFGHLRFTLIYVLSGLAGNLLSLVVQGNQAVSGGASGAIFGVYGALLVFVWIERQAFARREFRWLFWGVAGFSLASLLLGVFVPGIDNSAHLGGLLAGMLSGTLLGRPLGDGPPWPKLQRFSAGLALLAGCAFLSTQIPEPSYRWQEEVGAREEISQFLHDEFQIQARWQQIVRADAQRQPSFQSLADRIEHEITDFYDESLEQFSALHLDPQAPSAAQLDALRNYARQRRDASREFAQQIRTRELFGTQPPASAPGSRLRATPGEGAE